MLRELIQIAFSGFWAFIGMCIIFSSLFGLIKFFIKAILLTISISKARTLDDLERAADILGDSEKKGTGKL